MAQDATDKNYEGIQTLRFVAAFLVVLTHATFYAQDRLGPGAGFWWQGGAGVNIFFVISGFVMVASTFELRGVAHAWRIFITRRLVRIVPMYWVATTIKLLVLLAAPAFVLHSRIDTGHIVSSYFFIPTVNAEGEFKPLLAVGWTLYFEMFFYALFALALALRAPLYWFLGVVLCGFATLYPLRDPAAPLTMFFDPLVLQFFLGMLVIALVRRGPNLSAWMARAPIVPTALSLAGLVLLLFVPVVHEGTLPAGLKTAIPAMMVVLGVAWLEPVLKGRVPKLLLLFGDASYTLYLFHPLAAPIVPVVLQHIGIHRPFLSIALSVLLALMTGLAAHFWLEKPVARALKALTRRRAGTPSIPPPAPARGDV